MKEMEEELNIVEETVENTTPEVDNPVEEVAEVVDNKKVETDEVEEKVENQEISVENNVEPVDNMEETVKSDVDNMEEAAENCENPVEFVEEPVETVDNSDENTGISENETEEAVEEPKKKAPWKAIVAVLILVVAGIFAYSHFGGAETKPILYAKDNGLYVADGVAESVLLYDNLGEDAGYHYYYGAWGALSAEESTVGYYLVDVDEMGVGELHVQDLESPKGSTKIADDVFSFNLSADGSVCLYLTMEDEMAVTLHVAKDGVSQVVTDTMLMQEDAYGINVAGTHVVFQEDNGVDISLHVMDVATGEITLLAEQSILFTIPEVGDAMYHIAYENEINVLYEYAYGGAETKIGENVYFFDLMPEDGSALYATLDMEGISYADLIADDVTDLSAFDAERQAIIIALREQMAMAEAAESILQDAFLWKDGVSIPFERQIISLAPLTGEGNFFFGYGVSEFEKLPISEINSLDEAIMMYYSELAYGEKSVFVGNEAGDVYDLETNGEIPTAMMISGDGAKVAYLLATDTGNRLVLETLGLPDSAVEVARDVYNYAFAGEAHTLVYYNNYVDGVGELHSYVGGESVLLDAAVLGVSYAEHDGSVTYLANPDTTGNGDMKVYDGATTTMISENVFSFQCREANSTVYMKNYDLESEVGDIYHYFNGKSLLIAEDATAIFMY